MTDSGDDKLRDDLLAEMGFKSDDELRSFLAKLNAFEMTLTETERKVFRASRPTCQQAVQTFHVGVTQDQLRAFIRERAPEGEGYTSCLYGTGKLYPPDSEK